MPGAWSGHERLRYTKYQIVMIISLLCNNQWLGGRSTAFALICQYLSSTVRDLVPSIFLSTEGGMRGLPHLHERNNL